MGVNAGLDIFFHISIDSHVTAIYMNHCIVAYDGVSLVVTYGHRDSSGEVRTFCGCVFLVCGICNICGLGPDIGKRPPPSCGSITAALFFGVHHHFLFVKHGCDTDMIFIGREQDTRRAILIRV